LTSRRNGNEKNHSIHDCFDGTVSLPVPRIQTLTAQFGVAWIILMIVHLALHWKWIASTTWRYIHVNLWGTNDFQGQEHIQNDARL
jgi:hypothetical protein